METEILGILSGIGHLPVDVAKSAKERGCRIVAIGVVPDIDPELPEVADVYYDIHIGKIGKIISTLKKNNVKIVTMIGKVTKEILYKKGAIIPDMRAIKILSSVPDRKDDTIMNAIVAELQSEDIFVMDQTYLIKPLMPGPGVLTKRQPTPEELADMDFGYKMAKEIGRLDIGLWLLKLSKAPTPAFCAAVSWVRTPLLPKPRNLRRTTALTCRASALKPFSR